MTMSRARDFIGKALGLLVAVVTGGCDMAASPDGGGGDPQRRVVTIAESGATNNATLSIPRYKIYQQEGAPERLWVGLGMESGDDTFFSADGGESWTAVAAMGWEYHMSLDGNADGFVHFIDRGDPAATYHRLRGTEFQPEHRTMFSDFGGETTSGNIAVNGREVVIFTRNQESDRDPIHYHRSTDNGETWESGTIAGTGNPSNLRHRIGSVIVDGEISLAYWRAGGAEDGDTVTLFRWNGSEFEQLDHVYTTAARSPWTREYAVTQDSAGTIHLVTWDLVDGEKVVRHSRRTLESEWSDPETVVRWDNDEIMPQLSAVGDRIVLVYQYSSESSEDADAQAFYRVWSPETGWAREGRRLSSDDSGAVRYPIAPQEVSPGSEFIPVVWTEARSGLLSDGYAVRYTPLALER